MNELIKQINLCESKAQDADSVFYSWDTKGNQWLETGYDQK